MTNTLHIHIPTLRSDRVLLRAPKPSDLEAVSDFYASERAIGVGGPFPASRGFDRLCNITGHWYLRGFGRWVLADPQDDSALGIIGLMRPDDWPEAEIAWTVFEAAEGRGLAFEAATMARAYAYDTLGWTTAISCIKPDNARSIALAKRMGATKDYVFNHADIGPMDVWRHPAPQELAP